MGAPLFGVVEETFPLLDDVLAGKPYLEMGRWRQKDGLGNPQIPRRVAGPSREQVPVYLRTVVYNLHPFEPDPSAGASR